METEMPTLAELTPILESAKQAAIAYMHLTGKPLGITGEIGEYLAAKHLGLVLADARTPGYDAVDCHGKLFQIKSRAIPNGKRHDHQRVGSIHFKYDWDCVVLVVMNELFEPVAMYEAEREAIKIALQKPVSKARNE